MERMGVPGPHVLPFIADDALKEEGKLKAGEIAEIRYGVWKFEAEEDGNENKMHCALCNYTL